MCVRVSVCDPFACVNERNGREWALYARSAYAKQPSSRPATNDAASKCEKKTNTFIVLFIYNNKLLNQKRRQNSSSSGDDDRQKKKKKKWYPTDNEINTLRRHCTVANIRRINIKVWEMEWNAARRWMSEWNGIRLMMIRMRTRNFAIKSEHITICLTLGTHTHTHSHCDQKITMKAVSRATAAQAKRDFTRTHRCSKSSQFVFFSNHLNAYYCWWLSHGLCCGAVERFVQPLLVVCARIHQEFNFQPFMVRSLHPTHWRLNTLMTNSAGPVTAQCN